MTQTLVPGKPLNNGDDEFTNSDIWFDVRDNVIKQDTWKVEKDGNNVTVTIIRHAVDIAQLEGAVALYYQHNPKETDV